MKNKSIYINKLEPDTVATTGNLERAGFSEKKIQPQINANERKSIRNGRSWWVNFDPFALIRVCLCGKKFPNGRIGSMLAVFRYCCSSFCFRILCAGVRTPSFYQYCEFKVTSSFLIGTTNAHESTPIRIRIDSYAFAFIRLVPVDNSLIFINFMNRLRAKRTDSLTNRFFLLSIRPV